MSESEYWYMSFCDPERPEGTQFLGACWVRTDPDEDLPVQSGIPCFADDGVARAITKSHLLKINPGGEVAALGPFSLDAEKAGPYLHRLMDRAEAESVPDLR